MGFTAPNVWRGLAGFHLVTDHEEAALPLPRGARDLPLMICDRSFGADGGFAYPALDDSQQRAGVTPDYMDGVLGDVILVNGAPWPVLHADRARYRLRVLNGSNARRYTLALSPPPPGGGGLARHRPAAAGWCRSAATGDCWTGRWRTTGSRSRRPSAST